jgi:hypothetical protein
MSRTAAANKENSRPLPSAPAPRQFGATSGMNKSPAAIRTVSTAAQPINGNTSANERATRQRVAQGKVH